MDPNHDRAVQAAFDGYVPASELTAAKADIEHLSALWIAETRENEKLRAALKEISETSLYEWEFDEGRVCGKIHLIAARALEQKAPLSYRDDPRPSEVIAKDGWPDERS